MKILLTCGGTAGHINPAVALARMFQERMEDSQVLFVGAKGGMEERLVPKEGFPLETVTISSFWRSLSPSSLRHNLRTLRNLSVSKKEAARILDGFQPDLVVGTGGYASYPVVHEAARRGIPTAVHESNAVPGLTTQRLAKVADRVMVGYEDSRQHYHHPDRVVVTGTPVRGEFFRLTRQQARDALGIRDDRAPGPVLLGQPGGGGDERLYDRFHPAGLSGREPPSTTSTGRGGTMGPCRRPWRGSPCRRRSSCGSTSMTCPR